MKTQTGSIGKAVGFNKTSGTIAPTKVYPLGENVDQHGRKFVQTKLGRIY